MLSVVTLGPDGNPVIPAQLKVSGSATTNNTLEVEGAFAAAYAVAALADSTHTTKGDVSVAATRSTTGNVDVKFVTEFIPLVIRPIESDCRTPGRFGMTRVTSFVRIAGGEMGLGSSSGCRIGSGDESENPRSRFAI